MIAQSAVARFGDYLFAAETGRMNLTPHDARGVLAEYHSSRGPLRRALDAFGLTTDAFAVSADAARAVLASERRSTKATSFGACILEEMCAFTSVEDAARYVSRNAVTHALGAGNPARYAAAERLVAQNGQLSLFY